MVQTFENQIFHEVEGPSYVYRLRMTFFLWIHCFHPKGLGLITCVLSEYVLENPSRRGEDVEVRPVAPIAPPFLMGVTFYRWSQ
jgi:hypothetical protein